MTMKRRKSRPRNRKGLGSFNKKRKRKELTNKTSVRVSRALLT
jgi:hypothetical protein